MWQLKWHIYKTVFNILHQTADVWLQHVFASCASHSSASLLLLYHGGVMLNAHEKRGPSQLVWIYPCALQSLENPTCRATSSSSMDGSKTVWASVALDPFNVWDIQRNVALLMQDVIYWHDMRRCPVFVHWHYQSVQKIPGRKTKGVLQGDYKSASVSSVSAAEKPSCHFVKKKKKSSPVVLRYKHRTKINHFVFSPLSVR